MRKILFFLPALFLLICGNNLAKAQTDEEYQAALASILDGENYTISTVVDNTTYYLTTAGTLTTDLLQSGTFTFNKVAGVQYEYGFNVNSGSTRFSNPINGTEAALRQKKLNTTGYNRADWEGQVFFLKDGKYAVRATNAADGSGYNCSAFWTVNESEEDGALAEYSYDVNYCWELTLASVSEIKNNKAYYFKSWDRGYISVNNGTMVATSTGTYATEPSPFAILTYNDNQYVYSIADKKFFKLSSEEIGQNLTNLAQEVDSPSETWIINKIGTTANKAASKFPYAFYINHTNFRMNAGGRAGGDLTFNSWSAHDGGNLYAIIPAGDFDEYQEVLDQIQDYIESLETVSFIYTDAAGNEIARETEEFAPGTVLEDIPAKRKRGYVTYSSIEPLTVTKGGSNEIRCQIEWEFPFDLSESFDKAHWYNMAIRGTWYVTSDQTDESGALMSVNANAMGLVEDAYQWAFVGTNPYNVKIYNKAKGDNLVFSGAGVEQNQGVPSFTEEEYYWAFAPSQSQVAENAFVLNVPMSDLYINQFGGEGGSLKFWDSRNNLTDRGSAFTIFEIPDDFSEYAVAEILTYLEPTGYFTLTDEAKKSIGWQDSYNTTCPYEAYKNMKTTLAQLMDDINSRVLPEDGYYRMNNRMQNSYNDHPTWVRNITGVVQSHYNDDNYDGAFAIVKVERNEDNPLEYAFKIQGKYIDGSKSGAVAASETPVWHTAAIGYYGGPLLGCGEFHIENLYFHSNAWGGIYDQKGEFIAYAASDANASNWIFEDATTFPIALHEGEGEYWATMYAPFGYTLPADAEAYIGKVNDAGNYLNLISIGQNVPAGTAVVIKAKGGSITATINDDIADITDKGDLTGQYLAYSEQTYEVYTLGIYNGVVGFYLYDDIIGANKAVLRLANSGNANGYKFVIDDDDITGIDDAASAAKDEQGVYYDLQGRRVATPQKGQLYIVNGKTVVYQP